MDPKSFIIGALAAVIVFLAMGAAGKVQDTPKEDDSSIKGKLSSVERRFFQKLTAPMPGRFQVEATEDYAVIVDTATGEAWKHYLKSGPVGLCPPKLEPVGN